MKRSVWHNLPDWSLISYGNGTSFLLVNKPALASIHFQGDDADQFQAELEGLTERAPHLSYADAFAALWNDYSAYAERDECTV
jgi:hypothetical protein